MDNQCQVPLWEREFCSLVGGISWQRFCENKHFAYMYKEIEQWDDSGAFENLQNAKSRFWSHYHGQPSDIPFPGPDRSNLHLSYETMLFWIDFSLVYVCICCGSHVLPRHCGIGHSRTLYDCRGSYFYENGAGGEAPVHKNNNINYHVFYGFIFLYASSSRPCPCVQFLAPSLATEEGKLSESCRKAPT